MHLEGVAKDMQQCWNDMQKKKKKNQPHHKSLFINKSGSSLYQMEQHLQNAEQFGSSLTRIIIVPNSKQIALNSLGKIYLCKVKTTLNIR